MTDEPTRTLPTEAEVAEVLIQYETGGLCHYGRTCGTCDCGRADIGAEQREQRDAMERDRARAVLALFGNRPTVAQVKAEAWDEGYGTGVHDERTAAEVAWPEYREPGRVNPYRVSED